MVRRIPSSGRPSARHGPPRPLLLLGRGLGRGSRRPPSLRLVVSPVFDLVFQKTFFWGLVFFFFFFFFCKKEMFFTFFFFFFFHYFNLKF